MSATFPTLTERQAKALELVGRGLSTVEIAAEMEVKPRTAKQYVDVLRRKFGVSFKRELIPFAQEMKR